MATVKEVKAHMRYLQSDTKVTQSPGDPESVHVQGFVLTDDLKTLVRAYSVFLHSDGALCVE